MTRDAHSAFMREALQLASLAGEMGEVPVGALVVCDGEIVGRGHNLRESRQDPTAHAAIIAVQQAAETLGSWRLEGCTIYVTLEPCPMCAGALVLARIAQCVYGCSDPKGGYVGTLGDLSDHPGLNHRFDVVSGVLEEECSDRLRVFFRNLRATKREERWPSG